MQEKYLIWSIEHNAWWKPKEWGYTRLKKEAGIYSKNKALEIIKEANVGDNDIPNEAMILIDDMGEDLLSDCCGAKYDKEHEICMDCKEHCGIRKE